MDLPIYTICWAIWAILSTEGVTLQRATSGKVILKHKRANCFLPLKAFLRLLKFGESNFLQYFTVRLDNQMYVV